MPESDAVKTHRELQEDGTIVEAEIEPGVAYRYVPGLRDGGESVWRRVGPAVLRSDERDPADEPVVPSGKNGTMTRAKARVQLRQRGMYPYREDVDNFLKARRLTESEKARHSVRLANKVREGLRLDEQVRRAVESEGK